MQLVVMKPKPPSAQHADSRLERTLGGSTWRSQLP